VAARLGRHFDESLRRADEPSGSKELIGGDKLIVIGSKQEHRRMNLGKIDPASKRHETTRGNLVLFEKPAADLEIECSWQINRSDVPPVKTVVEFAQPGGIDAGGDLKHAIGIIRIKCRSQ
jgi:hypothetical protein